MLEETSGAVVAVDETNAVTTETPAEGPTPAAEQPKPQEEAKPETAKKDERKGGFVRKLEKLEQELAAVRAENQALRTPAQQADDPRPQEADFNDFGAYTEAISRWSIRQELARQQEAKRVESAKTQAETRVTSYRAKVEEVRDRLPDFDEVVNASDIEMTPAMRDVLLDSDIGPEIAYYLAKNPVEGHKASQMGTVELARYIGRLESKLEGQKSAPAAVKTTKAPPPITPVGSNSGAIVNKAPDDMSFEEYKAWRAKQAKA